jgi:hypothetical protein
METENYISSDNWLLYILHNKGLSKYNPNYYYEVACDYTYELLKLYNITEGITDYKLRAVVLDDSSVEVPYFYFSDIGISVDQAPFYIAILEE